MAAAALQATAKPVLTFARIGIMLAVIGAVVMGVDE